MEDHQGLGDVAPPQTELIRELVTKAAVAAHNTYCPHCFPSSRYEPDTTSGCPGFNEVDLGVAANVLCATADSLKTAATKAIWDAVEKVRFDGEHE